MSSMWTFSSHIRKWRHTARHSRALLRSSIAKKNMRSKQFWTPGTRGEDVNCNTSCTGRAIHTQMTHGLRIKTSMPPNSLQNSCIPTPLWLDNQRYKKTPLSLSKSLSSPCPPTTEELAESLRYFYLSFSPLKRHVSPIHAHLRPLS